MYPYFLRAFLVLPILLSLTRLGAQCSPDLTPPVAICDAILNVSLDANGAAVVTANVFDDGSYDLCCLDTLLVRRMVDGPCDSDTAPDDFSDAVLFCCADAGSGTVMVQLRVSDCAGNTNDCFVEVSVADKLKPLVIAPANVTLTSDDFEALNIDLNDTTQMNAAFGAPNLFDNCSVEVVHNVVANATNCLDPSSIVRTFTAIDQAGNTSKATQNIQITLSPNAYIIHVPGDFYPNDPSMDTLTIDPDTLLIGTSYEDVVYLADCFGPQNRINRTWRTLNWCGFIQGTQPFVLPKLDMDGDGRAGDAYDVEVQADSVYLLINGVPTTSLGARAEFFEYLQVIRQSPADTLNGGVYGKIFLDASGNCAYDAGETLYPTAKVIITGLVSGEVYEVTPDVTGNYYQLVCPEDTLVEITLDLPWNYGQSCPTTYTVSIDPEEPTAQDVPVSLNEDCALLTVDLSSLTMRRCFPNSYTVQVCNLSSETVPDVHVEVALDSYFDFTSGSLPGTALGNNTWSFDLGNMPAGTCSQFSIGFNLSCDAPLGYTHCSTANVYPDTTCSPPPLPVWSGANVEVQALCDGDSVRLSILNTGTGNMSQPLDFVVVEDVIMFQSGTFQLNSNSTQQLAVMANGATWRIEAEQETNHPWGGIVAAALEGCGGLNTPGLVTLFPLNSSNPFEATDCQENVGSYDPNDKQAFPRGYGSEHLVEANTDLEYKIRFQNTGTDTAFTVVVLDTLSQLLDISSVRPGAASHAYDFSILDGNVLRFRFNNIMLPDSNVNEPASNGFLKFRVSQIPDLADGNRIENTAAIYFDFNDPVLTNTTFHTIGDHFILVNTDPGPAGLPAIQVFPNPATDAVFFDLPVQANAGRFVLVDALGQAVLAENFSGMRYRFERKGLVNGVYFYQITVGDMRWTGKVLLK